MLLGSLAVAFGLFGFIMSSAFGAERAEKGGWVNWLGAAGAGGIAIGLVLAFAARCA